MKNRSLIYIMVSWIYKVLLNRAVLTGFVILSEVIGVFIVFTFFSTYSTFLLLVNLFVTISVMFNILSKNTHPSYKLAWAIIVLLFPLAGGAAYLIFANKRIPKKLRNIELSSIRELSEKNLETVALEKQLQLYNYDLLKLFNFLKNTTYYNYHKNTSSRYYCSGEEMFADAIEDLKTASDFILIEYFIVADGELFSEIFEILKERISEGVDVFLIYDDFGSINTVDLNLVNRLEKIGVDVTAFNPMRLGSVSKLNYRTHRKILDIDNRIAYTGGINLADEYVNKKERFGYWKDTAVRIEGEAVNNFTIMFLQNYYGINNIDYSRNELEFKKHLVKSNEFVMPFSISPSDNYSTARNIHLNLLSMAKKSFYIHTPYLIIDYDMTNALINAANSGVDVIITVPAIPDKKIVNLVTKCNYEKLVLNGVKIFEYKPGFLHSKSCIVDGEVLLMSGINMDFRSYFLNFETGVLIANSDTVLEAEKDYLDTLKECEEITQKMIENMPLYKKFFGHLFSIFAPLI